jgi:sugar lactone lactonase YvrE
LGAISGLRPIVDAFMYALMNALSIAAMSTLDSLTAHGHGLMRPECVLAHESGLLFAADWAGNGGVAIVSPDGMVRRIEARTPIRPNGIALEPGGTFLVTHLGAETGGVFRLHASGEIEPILTELDGHPLPPTNFVARDAEGGLWITISTRVVPRADDYRPSAASGFVVRCDRQGARIAADRLGYTNECLLEPDGRHLLVVETFARRLTRFRIGAGHTLVEPQTIARFGPGTFPDGLAMDVEGGIWIASIVSNRVLRRAPDGTASTILEDCDADFVDAVEAAYETHSMGRPHLDRAAGKVLRNISSLAFGGPDMTTLHLGSLLDDRIRAFRAPVAGAVPPHFRYSLGPLAQETSL